MLGCGNAQISFAFFISFMFLVSLVFLKLFIAIILEGYKETQTQDTRLFNNDMNQHFREIWAEFDQDVSDIEAKYYRQQHSLIQETLEISFLNQEHLQDSMIPSTNLASSKINSSHPWSYPLIIISNLINFWMYWMHFLFV